MPRRKPPAPPVPNPAEPRRSRWFLLGVAVSALLICLGREAPAENGGAYGTVGYTRVLNELFGPMHWLELAAPDEEGGSGPVVTLSAIAAAQEPVRRFLVESPLLRDLAARDERLWRISGSHVLGLDPAARRAPGPFERGTRWTGDILYEAAPAPAELVSPGGRTIALVRRPARAPAPVTLDAVPVVAAPQQQAVQEVFDFTDETGAALARVRLIGRNVVVFPAPGEASAEVLVEPAARRGAATAAVVPEGGSIRFRRNGMPVGPSFRLRQAPEGLSIYRAFGARMTDPSLGRFGQAIEQAVATSGLAGDQDVRLTLDASLHLQIQQQLETYSENLLRATGRRPFRAAVSVMDTRSGELLALASYPTRQPLPTRGAAPESWLESNHNFSALPIGSAAKVPVTAAIVSQHPRLTGLRIQGSPGGYDRVFGIHLGRTVGETASAEWVDFPTYLRQSSNKYATALMLMGLTRDPFSTGPCRSDPYSFAVAPGGAAVERVHAPQFVLPQQPAQAPDARQGGRCGGAFGPVSGNLSSILHRGVGTDWLSLFRAIFDIPGLEQPPSPDHRFDVGIWGGYSLREGVDPFAFASVSPERESFGLGSIRNLQNDYVSLILGGVRSRWTATKVAEAYSRLVIARRVHARIVRDNSPAGGALAELGAEARSALLAGMEEVVRPGGTAFPYVAAPLEALNGRVPPGEQLRVFAKTGTPSLARSRPIPERQALNNLASERLIRLEGDRRLVVAGKRPGQSEREALLALPQLSREAERFGVTPERIVREFEQVRRQVAERPAQIVGPDGVVRLPASQIVEEVGGREITGGVIALVIGRYCSGEADPRRPIQAMTLVVNIQARTDYNAASRFAAQVLAADSEFSRLLFGRSSHCPAARQAAQENER